MLTTLFYVIVGCAIQFVIGTALAFLCSQPISGKNFFRVIFFIPLMITPLGVGYAFKMILDITKGPFQPFWDFIGLRRLGLVDRCLGGALVRRGGRLLAVDSLHLHLHAGRTRKRAERSCRSRSG